MSTSKLIILAVISCALFCFFYFDASQYLTLEQIKANQGQLESLYHESPLKTLMVFMLVFTVYSSLPFPGLILFTLLGSALFGFIPAFLIVSFGSAIGGTIAFFGARYLLRDTLQNLYPKHFETINEGFTKEGAFYLFSIRLMPLFPYFLVNMLMGITSIKGRDFYIATQLGMVASTAVFVNAGTQLSQIESVNSLFSPQLILSFLAMGLVPLISKRLIELLRKQNHTGSEA